MIHVAHVALIIFTIIGVITGVYACWYEWRVLPKKAPRNLNDILDALPEDRRAKIQARVAELIAEEMTAHSQKDNIRANFVQGVPMAPLDGEMIKQAGGFTITFEDGRVTVTKVLDSCPKNMESLIMKALVEEI